MKKPAPEKPKPMPRVRSTPELNKFAKRVESESNAYNWRSRNNLRRGKDC